jgi:hypothetical protein
MILISHRGNLSGPNESRENSPEYIIEALSMGYNVEVDVWHKDECFWLGHDKPQYQTDYKFLMEEKLWCHAKNPEAIVKMKKFAIHYFWHEEDTLALTSKNYIWTYPNKQPIVGSIAVMPELFNDNISLCIGVCSDYIQNYKK